MASDQASVVSSLLESTAIDSALQSSCVRCARAMYIHSEVSFAYSLIGAGLNHVCLRIKSAKV
jgi:hypothetical protein